MVWLHVGPPEATEAESTQLQVATCRGPGLIGVAVERSVLIYTTLKDFESTSVCRTISASSGTEAHQNARNIS